MKIKLTKEYILEEAQKLFAKKGFSAVSMQDIAKAVGIKKPSLYYFYTSKEHLFASVMTVFWERLAGKLQELQFGSLPQKKKDVEYFAEVLEHFLQASQYGGRAMTEISVMKQNKDSLCKEAFVHIEKCKKLLKQFLQIQKVKDPEVAHQVIANAIHMYIIHSQFEKPTVSGKNYAFYIAKLVLNNN